MLNIADKVFCQNRITGRLELHHVIRVTATQAELESGIKIKRQENKGKYEIVPKDANTPCIFLSNNPAIGQRYVEEQNKLIELQKEAQKSYVRKFVENFDIEKFFSANSTGLVFAMFLLIAQTMHSGDALTKLAVALPYSTLFGYMSAIFLDALILFFAANGAKWSSWVAMVTCIILNLYSYHFGFSWGSYDSWFSLLPSIAIPYSIHRVSDILRNKNKIQKK